MVEVLLGIHGTLFHYCKYKNETLELFGALTRVDYFSLFQFIIFYGLISYEPLKYNDYEYPMWVNFVGFLVAASSVMCIPITAIVLIVKTPGTLKEASLLGKNKQKVQK